MVRLSLLFVEGKGFPIIHYNTKHSPGCVCNVENESYKLEIAIAISRIQDVKLSTGGALSGLLQIVRLALRKKVDLSRGTSARESSQLV
jgi:hypothetical protein